MSLLVRSLELVKRPVVTLTGEDVAQIKDVVYAGPGSAVRGFTLNGLGLFSGPLKVALPIESVIAIGRDAVMIADEGVLTEFADIAERSDVRDRNVLGNRVVTDGGADLGAVTDVILQVGPTTEVVGYEVQATPALHPEGRHMLIPLPHTLAVSGEALVVPSAVVEFVSDDLSGFGAAVEAFRARLDVTT